MVAWFFQATICLFLTLSLTCSIVAGSSKAFNTLQDGVSPNWTLLHKGFSLSVARLSANCSQSSLPHPHPGHHDRHASLERPAARQIPLRETVPLRLAYPGRGSDPGEFPRLDPLGVLVSSSRLARISLTITDEGCSVYSVGVRIRMFSFHCDLS